MQHLSSERLAELADSVATPAEREHLAGCATCASERDAHRRLLSLAADERVRLAPPLTDWDTLAVALREEGILATPLERHTRRWARPVLRAAAAIVLVAGGTMLGRVSAGAPALPLGASATAAVAADDPDLARDQGDTPAFTSAEQALATLTSAQRAYDRAAAYLATSDSTIYSESASDAYRTRLAALDRIAEASREALYELPADPVINQYYVSSIGAREATLRQLGTALPVGTRLTRF